MKNKRKCIIYLIIIIFMIFNCKKDKDKKSDKIEVQKEVKATNDNKEISNNDITTKIPDYKEMIIGTWQNTEVDTKEIYYKNGTVEMFEYGEPIPFSPMEYRIEDNKIKYAQSFDLPSEDNTDVIEIQNIRYSVYFEFINDHKLILTVVGIPEKKYTYIKIE